MNYNSLVNRLMNLDILDIKQTKIYDCYQKLTEKLRDNIDNLNKIRKEYPLKAASGTVTTTVLEFSYALGLLGRYNTFVDFALIGTFMLPLFTGFYLDRKKF